MKQRIYNLIIPKNIRESIYRHNILKYKEQEYRRLILQEETATCSELSPIYISNLRLVSDQNALFNQMPKHSIVAMVGANTGDLSRRILAINKPKKLHIMDDWGKNDAVQNARESLEQKLKAEISSNQVMIHSEDPLLALRNLGNGYLDWAYIDTDPSFENTAKTLEICRSKIKAHGVIAGHNYTKGDWVSKNCYGVIPAVHKFCKEYKYEMVFLTHESDRCLSFALRKIKPLSEGNQEPLDA